jgi:DNA repair exonuclease SbcCD ATPase subunit
MLRTNEITSQISQLEKDVNSLQGQYSLLTEQLATNEQSLKDLQKLQIINAKAIEVLHLIKKVTEDKIIENFEKIGTSALQVIHQSNDYKFKLHFGRKGAFPTVEFCVLTPEMQEYHDILSVSAGGSRDVLALALRFIVLELSQNKGFLFLDEPEKRLDNPETLKQMIKFIIDFQQKTGRQMMVITHKQEFVDAVPNPIIMKSKKESMIKAVETSTSIEGVNIKLNEPKKKGRPKKEIKNGN